MISAITYAQKPKVEAVRYKEVTTAQRDALTVPSGEHWKIYNITTLQFEYWDGDSWEAVSGGGGLSNIVEDITPQLGGDLDVNLHDIVSARDSINIKADQRVWIGDISNTNHGITLEIGEAIGTNNGWALGNLNVNSGIYGLVVVVQL